MLVLRIGILGAAPELDPNLSECWMGMLLLLITLCFLLVVTELLLLGNGGVMVTLLGLRLPCLLGGILWYSAPTFLGNVSS